MTDMHRHEGTLCVAGHAAVRLALQLGRARIRIAELEVTLARVEALAERLRDKEDG